MDAIVDVSNVVLKTERLILRAWQESDRNDFFEYASVEGVGEMAGWKHHTTMEETQKILNSFIAGKNVFAIVYRDNNKVIGSLGLHTSWANQEKEYENLKTKDVGYVLSKDYWGRGLIPEAVRALIDYCFSECGIELLTCGHFETNLQSKRVIEKCGFQFKKKSQYCAEQLQQNYVYLEYVLLPSSLPA